ncbi:MAG: hypothetical protein P8Y45_22225, partial [Exilibacterium sp.]
KNDCKIILNTPLFIVYKKAHLFGLVVHINNAGRDDFVVIWCKTGISKSTLLVRWWFCCLSIWLFYIEVSKTMMDWH